LRASLVQFAWRLRRAEELAASNFPVLWRNMTSGGPEAAGMAGDRPPP
jgi:hypothetical protein